MKKLAAFGLMLILTCGNAMAFGQSPGSSLSFMTSGVCELPTLGKTILCGQLSGDFMESINGAAYKTLLGPQGPAGVAGPIGPVGPAGPPGTLPASFTCMSISLSSSGVVLSGCK